jgi:hypothetical protein
MYKLYLFKTSDCSILKLLIHVSPHVPLKIQGMITEKEIASRLTTPRMNQRACSEAMNNTFLPPHLLQHIHT